MRQVYSARDTMEAHFVRGLLEQEGIEAVVQGEMLGIARGELPLTSETLPSVWVRDEDVQRAASLIDEHRRGHRPPVAEGEPWICPECQQPLEPQFTHCWNCGAARPE